MPAPAYVIALECGATTLKTLLVRVSGSDMAVLATGSQPLLLPEKTLPAAVDHLAATALADGAVKSRLTVVASGEVPEVPRHPLLGRLVKISRDDSIAALLRQPSATGAVLWLDIGATTTTAALAKYGKVTVEAVPYGVGREAWSAVRRYIALEAVCQWLPDAVAPSDVEDYLANKSLFPDVIPTSAWEAMVEHALARALLGRISTELALPWANIGQIVVAGAVLASPARVAQTAAMLLDGLQPTGHQTIRIDHHGAALALGAALAWHDGDVRDGELVLAASLPTVGTILSLAPTGHVPRPARITLDAGLDTPQAMELRPGDLVTIPLTEELAGLRLGSSGHVPGLTTGATTMTTAGGRLGLVVDGRPRPIVLPSADGERTARLAAWSKQLNLTGTSGQIGGPV